MEPYLDEHSDLGEALAAARAREADALRRLAQIETRLAETDRRLAEAERRIADQDRCTNDFLAMLAHELRNPLAPIRNAAHILRIGPAGDERARQAGAIIARQVDHMTELVGDLLDVSRVTRGRVTLDKEVADLREIVSAAAEQTSALVQ